MGLLRLWAGLGPELGEEVDELLAREHRGLGGAQAAPRGLLLPEPPPVLGLPRQAGLGPGRGFLPGKVC